MALYITVAVLYIVALFGCCFKRPFFFAFYSSRVVLIICLSIILQHVGYTWMKVNGGLRILDDYRYTVVNSCGDQYAMMPSEQMDSNLNEAKYFLGSIIAFCVVVLVLTLMEVVVGMWFI